MLEKDCYILIYDTGEIINFQYAPDEFTETNEHNVEETRILTRNLPIIHSKGINSRLSFVLDLVASKEDKTDVIETINKLKARTLAKNGMGTKPSEVVIYWGKQFKDNHFYTVTNITPKYELWDAENNYLPTAAKVQISLTLSSIVPVTQDFFI